jgi:hypothetical protein
VKAVFNASSTYNWGKGITIEHNGITTLYLHVVPIASKGQSISKGQKIATIANITGPHLHFGIRESSYSNTANRGALPQINTTEDKYCKSDPIFPEAFIDPMTLAYNTGATSIMVTSPNGGEIWGPWPGTGVNQSIQWTSSDLSGNVMIELSRDEGSTWDTLFESTPNDGI